MVRLFRYDPAQRYDGSLGICGGLIAKRGGGSTNRFCISTNCVYSHEKKAFDKLGVGDFYIIEPGPGGKGAGSNQPKALLEPSLPRVAAEHSQEDREMLASENTVEAWMSLFRYMIDVQARGGPRVPNDGLLDFAAKVRRSGFTTPLLSSKRARREGADDASEGSSGTGCPDSPAEFKHAVLGMIGALGVRSPSAQYGTVHGGLKDFGATVGRLESEVEAAREDQRCTREQVHNEIMAVRYEAARSTAVTRETQRTLEQLQGTGGLGDDRRAMTEVSVLHKKCEYLEKALAQIAGHLSTLRDRVDSGGDARHSGFTKGVTHVELDTAVRGVRAEIGEVKLGMLGAPIVIHEVSFHGLDACIGWARLHMPPASYQCIPSMFYGLCLVRDTAVVYKEDLRDADIQAQRVKRSPMQSAVIESVQTAVPSVLEGPKTTALKNPKHEFGALKSIGDWKPKGHQKGAKARLQEGLDASWKQVRAVIDQTLVANPVARGVMLAMLADFKLLTTELLITEVSSYYEDILAKTGGEGAATKQVEESCWALVMKLLRTIIDEIHEVRLFAREAVSFGSDELSTNGIFLSAAVEELGVLRAFAKEGWRNHPKFNQNIVTHLFETCLPRAVYEGRTEGAGSHILKITALQGAQERHEKLLSGLQTGLGEVRGKVGLSQGKKTKFGKHVAGGNDDIE